MLGPGIEPETSDIIGDGRYRNQRWKRVTGRVGSRVERVTFLPGSGRVPDQYAFFFPGRVGSRVWKTRIFLIILQAKRILIENLIGIW